MGTLRKIRLYKTQTRRRKYKGGSAETSAVCAIMKYEDKYVDEWIQYYLYGLGFTKIYIYDNSDENTLKDLPNKYKNVYVIHYPGKVKQLPAYNDWLTKNNALPETERIKWCAFFDTDEFLVLKKHDNITDFLKEYCKDGAVGINWYMFGDSHLKKYTPEPVTKRFVWRHSNIDQHVKSIVKCDDVESITDLHGIGNFKTGKHNKDTSGKVISGPFNPGGPTDVAVLNHYVIKTRDEHTHKKNRGRANTNNATKFRTNTSFNNSVKGSNEVQDDSAYKIYTKAQENMPKQSAGANLSVDLELVVARFTEDLKWVSDLPNGMFQHTQVYNKGPELSAPFEKMDVTALPNIGREGHTYLHHIIDNYDKLAKMTVFVPGSVRSKPSKTKQLDIILQSLKRAPNKSAIVENKGLNKRTEQSFTISRHVISNNGNRALNPNSSLNMANTNPLGPWFAKYVGNEQMRCLSSNGIFAASREDIQKRPKEFYERLITTVSTKNPTAGHYIERVWANILSIENCL